MNDQRQHRPNNRPQALTRLCALLLAAAVCGSAVAAEDPAGPRLFFAAQRVERLKAQAGKPGEIAEAWRSMIERAERLLKDELVSKEYAEGGSGQHGNYGRPSSQMADMGQTLGLAYRMTGDRRYADRLAEAMLHYATLNRWAGDAGHDPPWHSELNTARFCYGYAVGYDSIRDAVSPADRRSIVEAMVRLGIRPTLNDWLLGERRIHALDSMGHNWWSVCVAMAGLASLSIAADHPEAASWAQRVNEAFAEWFYYGGNILQNKCTNFDPKGAFYESVSYANYALSEYLIFRLAWPGVFPDRPAPSISLLETAGDFFVHTCYPTSNGTLAVNFGDSSLNADGSRTLRLLEACGYVSQARRWYLNRMDRGLRDPIALACGLAPSVPSPPADLPNSFAYEQIGWAMLRSSWSDDATLLAIKSGYAWNHAHPDAGSFLLFHNGKPLLIDSGNCSYSRPEYSSYYRQSHAHNVILTDGRAGHPEDCAGPDRGTVTPGSVRHLLDLGDLKYVLADATGPTSWKFSRNYRHFVWIDGVILIFDDVRTHEPGKLEWLLHYDGKADVSGAEIHVSAGDRAAVTVKMLYPTQAAVTEKPGMKDHDPDSQVPYLAWSPPQPMREAKLITALLPSRDDGSLPHVELLEADSAVGVRITDKDRVSEVYLNLMADGRRMHRNSCSVIDGWETDAAVFGVTRRRGDGNDPNSARRYLVACGSYLRKNGTVVLDCLSKVYTAFTEEGPDRSVQLSGQPLINLRLHADRRPETMTLNNRKVPVRYDASDRTITLTLDAR